jgi:hypothetical protein
VTGQLLHRADAIAGSKLVCHNFAQSNNKALKTDVRLYTPESACTGAF